MRAPLLVALGAALWATDTLFRHPLVQQISPFTIVYFEHIFATAISFIYLMCTRDRKQIWMAPKEIFAVAFVGIFGSALATVLFTMSFEFINPSVAILLQKTQPVFVILLSFLLLGEKLGRWFFFWASIACMAAYFVSFPTGFRFSDFYSGEAKGCFLALIAAGLWAISTTTGKLVLRKSPASVVSFWRFFFGLVALYGLSRHFDVMQVEIPFVPGQPGVMKSLFVMALVPGFLGVSVYYSGLQKVSASAASILELSFPVCALAINAYFLHFHLTGTQYMAAGALILAMIGVSRNSRT
jgi:drug/metabolite transporter (DMT)-like permease